MSTKTIYKRIALVAVASLGFGVLTSVSPASAALGAGDMTQNIVTVRTDDATYPVNPAIPGSLAVPTISIVEAAANDTNPAAIKVTYKATSTSTAVNITKALASAGAGTAASVALTGNVLLKITPATSGVIAATLATGGHAEIASGSNGAAGAAIELLVGRGALPGIYTVDLDLTGADSTTTFASNKSLSITVTGAPSSVSITGTGTTNTKTVINGDTTETFVVTAKDAAGRGTYLLAGESIALTENGTGLSVTTPALPFLTSAELSSTQETMSSTVTLTLASLPTGTYTLTATPSMAGVAAATGSLVYSTTTARMAAASVVLTSPTTQLSGGAATVTALPTASTNSVTIGTAEKVVYSNLSNTSFTFRIKAGANDVGFVQYTVGGSGVTTVPAAGTYIATLTPDATASYADVTITASNITTDGTVSVTAWEDATAGDGSAQDYDPKVTVTYKVPVLAVVSFTNPNADDIAVKTGSTVNLEATATDQYKNVLSNQTVYFSVAAGGRGTAAEYPRVTNASGIATLSLTDTSTSTTALADTIKVDTTAGAGDTGGTLTDSLGFAYAADISATTMTAVSYIETTNSYSGVLKADGTTEVTIDATNTSATYTDQFYMAVTLKNAALANLKGLPVVFTVTGGTIAAETDTTPGAITVGTLGVSTVTVYTDSNGVARAAVQVTKVGAVKVTATNGTLTQSATVTALAGANTTARTIAATIVGALVSATVKDGYGNGVPGVAVTLSASGGTFQTGSNTVSATTDANGVATASLSPGAAVSVKATIATGGTQSATAAATPVTNWTAGVASATATAASVATADNTSLAALTTLINSLIAKINALNKLVIKIQKKVRA